MCEKELIELIGKTEKLSWRCHTPNLLREIAGSNHLGAMTTAISIMQTLLVQLAAIAIEIDDPKFNSMMIRLTLYDQADPSSKDYNFEQVQEWLKLTEPKQCQNTS